MACRALASVLKKVGQKGRKWKKNRKRSQVRAGPYRLFKSLVLWKERKTKRKGSNEQSQELFIKNAIVLVRRIDISLKSFGASAEKKVAGLYAWKSPSLIQTDEVARLESVRTRE